MHFYEYVERVLKKDVRFVARDGTLLRNAVYEAGMRADFGLLRLLLDDEETKRKFFKEVNGILVFDKVEFGWVVNNRLFLPDSYTRFKNKIGLIDVEGKLISASDEVALVFPYKDCVLEGGQTKEEQKRRELFYNEILASDEIDRLLAPKVLTSAKRFASDGECRTSFLNDTDNLVLKGNNLLALSSLLKRYEKSVKCIYIDPPYNTGADSFLYNDSFKHSSWLLFMKNRLELAKRLLRLDGVIFVQCDDMELAYLKVLMDEIFSRDAYVNTITVESKANSGASGGGEDKRLKKNVEFILCYAGAAFTRFNELYNLVPIKDYLLRMEVSGKNNHYNSVYTSLGERRFYKTIYDGAGNEMTLYKHSGYSTKSVSRLAQEEGCDELEAYEKYFDKIFASENAQTSIRTRVREAVGADDSLFSLDYYPVSGRNKGRAVTVYFAGEKMRLISWFKDVCMEREGKRYKRDKIGSHWSGFNWNNVAREGGVSFPQGQKPEELIQRIIELSTDEGDLVLDFFAGSGTTGAVAHKLRRRYVVVEQMDYVDSILVTRLKNVIGGEQKGISQSVGWNGGGSFVYCELAKLNQLLVDEIANAQDTFALAELYERVVHSSFISYKVDPSEMNASKSDFTSLSFDEQKRFLFELLDKNFLYVNYCDIDDLDYDIAEEDKNFTRCFYGEI